MDYSLMSDEEILRNLAEQLDRLRISKQLKESDIEETAGISRKTLYNFKQGKTGFSLKNLIRYLRALEELGRLQELLPHQDSFSPMGNTGRESLKRVRRKSEADRDNGFLWGDEQ